MIVCLLLVAHPFALAAIAMLARAGPGVMQHNGVTFTPCRIKRRLQLSTLFQIIAAFLLVYFSFYLKHTYQVDQFIVMGFIPVLYVSAITLQIGAVAASYRFGRGSLDLPDGQSFRPATVGEMAAVSLLAHGGLGVAGPWAFLQAHGQAHGF